MNVEQLSVVCPQRNMGLIYHHLICVTDDLKDLSAGFPCLAFNKITGINRMKDGRCSCEVPVQLLNYWIRQMLEQVCKIVIIFII